MKIALVLHPSRTVAADLAGRVAAAARKLDLGITVDEADAGRVPGATTRPAGSLAADVVLAVGGDGTVLEAARRAVTAGLHVIGVNAGKVVFLAEIQTDEITAGLTALQSVDYSNNDRLHLTATTSTRPTPRTLHALLLQTDCRHN